ncbi:AT-hook motif nuclear-localized protein 1-like [Impatiens glandulifera]|uniref:AT-hook motif nuclear-localized protein 1-like n=1 Tax=Impatiens glandulifera TaxID=253017 RepID=UPI001FB0A1E2|nr:AT-hook motif nuclear-localized protein 1-like [Impatiens glandulifera]
MEDNTSDPRIVTMPEDSEAVEAAAAVEDASLIGGGVQIEDPDLPAVVVPVVEDASVIGGDECGPVVNEPILNSGGGENTSEKETVIIPQESAAVENKALHEPTLNMGESSMQENTSQAEMVTVPAVENEATLNGVGSSMKDDKEVIIPGDSSVQDVDKEVDHTLTIFKGGESSGMEEAKMQIIPIPVPVPVSTFSVTVVEDASAIKEDIIGSIKTDLDPTSAIFTTPTKRKRGRPKKILGSPSTLAKVENITTVSLTPPKPSPQSPATFPLMRRRGRPPGSKNLQKQSATGESVIPRILLVQKGEDIIERLDSLTRIDGSTIFIISGVGQVSTAHIQSGTSLDGISRHEEGPYTLLNLTGTYGFNSEAGRTGFMTVMLGSSSCHVIGGLLAGALVAAGPVQIVLGSIEDKRNQFVKRQCVGSPSKLNSPRVRGKSPIVEMPTSSSPSPTSSSPSSFSPDNNDENVDSN